MFQKKTTFNFQRKKLWKKHETFNLIVFNKKLQTK